MIDSDEGTGMPAGKDFSSGKRTTAGKKNTNCSFCRKSYREVGPLVEGPDGVYICGECIELCQSIIGQEKRRRQPAGEFPCGATPELIRERLDQLVPGQQQAKEALICV